MAPTPSKQSSVSAQTLNSANKTSFAQHEHALCQDFESFQLYYHDKTRIDKVLEKFNSCRSCHPDSDYEDWCDSCAKLPNIARSTLITACKQTGFKISSDEIKELFYTFPVQTLDFIFPFPTAHLRAEIPSSKGSLTYKTGDLFAEPLPYAHCISADVKMSAGIALPMRKVSVPSKNSVANAGVGGCVFYQGVFHLVTKSVYYGKPTIRTMEQSIISMVELAAKHHVTHISLPKMGCMRDRLHWPDVEALLLKHASHLHLTVVPWGNPSSSPKSHLPVHIYDGKTVDLTPKWSRARLVELPEPSFASSEISFASEFTFLGEDLTSSPAPVETFIARLEPVSCPMVCPKATIKFFPHPLSSSYREWAPRLRSSTLSFIEDPIFKAQGILVINQEEFFRKHSSTVRYVTFPKAQRIHFSFPRVVSEKTSAPVRYYADYYQVPRPFYTTRADYPSPPIPEPVMQYEYAAYRIAQRMMGRRLSYDSFAWHRHERSLHPHPYDTKPRKWNGKNKQPHFKRVMHQQFKQAGITKPLREIISAFAYQCLKDKVADLVPIVASLVSIVTSVITFTASGKLGRALHVGNIAINACSLFTQLAPQISDKFSDFDSNMTDAFADTIAAGVEALTAAEKQELADLGIESEFSFFVKEAGMLDDLTEDAKGLLSKILSFISIIVSILIFNPSSIFKLDIPAIQRDITSRFKLISDSKSLFDVCATNIYKYIFASDDADTKMGKDFMEFLTEFNKQPSKVLLANRRLISQAEKKVLAARDYIIRKNQHSNVFMVSLTRQIDMCFDKCNKLREVLASALPKPAALGVLVSGERGIGKTGAGLTIADRLDKKLYDSKGTYKITLNNNFYPVYAGQKVAYVEEFANNENLKDDKISQDINSMCSNGAFNFESAFDKTQPSDVDLVIMDTNAPFWDISKRLPLVLEAKQGFFSRLLLANAYWDKDPADLQKPRGMNGHEADFSHIRYKVAILKHCRTKVLFEDFNVSVMRNKKLVTTNDLSLTEFQNLIECRLKVAEENFAKLFPDHQERIDAIMNPIMGQVKEKRSACHAVLNIHGMIGDGKSAFVYDALIPYLERIMALHVIHKDSLLWPELENKIAEAPVNKRVCLVLDDSIYSENDELSYNKIFDHLLPQHSIIIIVSNMVPTESSYFNKLQHFSPNLKELSLKVEASYRRLGYDGCFLYNSRTIMPNNSSLCFRSSKVGLTSAEQQLDYNDAPRAIYKSLAMKLLTFGTVLVREVNVLPEVPEPNFGITFDSAAEFISAIKTKSSILSAVNSGKIFFTNSLRSQLIAKADFKDLCANPSLSASSIKPVIVNYMKAFRSLGILLSGKVRIGGVGEIAVLDATIYTTQQAPDFNITVVRGERETVQFFIHNKTFSLTYRQLTRILYFDERDMSLDVDLLETLTVRKEAVIKAMPEHIFNVCLDLKKEMDKEKYSAKVASFVQRVYASMKAHWVFTLFGGLLSLSAIWAFARSYFSSSPDMVPETKAANRARSGDESHPGANGPIRRVLRPSAPSSMYDAPRELSPEEEAELDAVWFKLQANNKYNDYDLYKLKKQSITPDWNMPNPSFAEGIFHTSINNNLVKVGSAKDGWFGSQTQGDYVVFGIGLYKNIFVAPRHIRERSDGTLSDVVFVQDDRFPTKSFQCKVLYQPPDSDLCFYALPLEGPSFSFRDITHLLPPSLTIAKHNLLVFCKKYLNTVSFHHGRITEIVTNGKTRDIFGDNNPITNFALASFAGSFDMPSTFGDCGLPYIDPVAAKTNNGCLVAIHIGGNRDPSFHKTSFSLLNRSMLEEAISIQNREEAFVQEKHKPLSCNSHDLSVHIDGTVLYALNKREFDIYRNIDVEDKGIAPFDNGVVNVLGTVDEYCSKIPKCGMKPTPYFYMAEAAFGPPPKIPTKQPSEWTEEELEKITTCRDGTKHGAIHQSVMFDEILPEPDSRLLDEVFAAYRQTFSDQAYQHCDFANPTAILNGYPAGTPYHNGFKPLQTDTAAGYTLTKLFPKVLKKSHVVSTSENGVRAWRKGEPAADFLMSKTVQAIRLAIEGKRCTSVFKTCVKMEKLKPEKAWKPRVFEVQDTHDVCAERYIMGRWAASNANKSFVPSCRVGLNAYTDWDALSRWHADLPYHIDIDYSRWDKRAHRALFELAMRLFEDACHSNPDLTPVMRTRWINAMRVTIQKSRDSIHLVHNILFMKNRGVPSGLFLTAPLNSLLNDLVLLCAFFHLYYKKFGHYPSYADFVGNVRHSTYGDDLLISITSSVKDWFNFTTIRDAILHLFGIVADSSAKDGTVIDYHDDLAETTFISRHFIYDRASQIWFGALKKESILANLYWVDVNCGKPSDLCQLLQVTLEEASYWGSEFYNQVRCVIERINREFAYGLVIDPYTKIRQDNIRLIREMPALPSKLSSQQRFNKQSAMNTVTVNNDCVGPLEIRTDQSFTRADSTDEACYRGEYNKKRYPHYAFCVTREYGCVCVKDCKNNCFLGTEPNAFREHLTTCPICEDCGLYQCEEYYEDHPQANWEYFGAITSDYYCSPSRCSMALHEVFIKQSGRAETPAAVHKPAPSTSSAPVTAQVSSTGVVSSESVSVTGTLETPGHVTAQELNLNLGAIPPAPQTTGMPFDILARMKTTSGNVVRQTITSDSKTAAPIAVISNDPTLLPAEHQVWVKAHTYWSAQTQHTLEIYGTEGLNGSVIIGWVPDVSKTYTINDLRKINFVIFPLNKYSSMSLIVDDFRNNNFNRLCVGDTNPYPGYVAMLYEPLANKFAADGKAFEVGVWTESYFHPAVEFYGPTGSIAPNENALPLDTFANTAITVPHSPSETCNLVVNSTQIPNTVNSTQQYQFPTIKSLNTIYESDLVTSRNLYYHSTLTVTDGTNSFDVPVVLFISGTIDSEALVSILNTDYGTDLAKFPSMLVQTFNDKFYTLSQVNNPNGLADILNSDLKRLDFVTQLKEIDTTDSIALFKFYGNLTFIKDSIFYLSTRNTACYLGLIWNNKLPTACPDDTVTISATDGIPLLPYPLTAFKIPLQTDPYKSLRTISGGSPLLFRTSENGISPVTLQVTSTIQPKFVVHDALCAVSFISENATASFTSKLANAPFTKFHLELADTLDDQCALLGTSLLGFELYNGSNLLGSFCYSTDFGFTCIPTAQNRVLTGLSANSLTVRNIRKMTSEIVPTISTSSWDMWISTPNTSESRRFFNIKGGNGAHAEFVKQAGMIFAGGAGLMSGLADAYYKQQQLDWQTNQNQLNRDQARWLQENSNAASLQRATLGYDNTLRNTRLGQTLQGVNQLALAKKQAEEKRLTDANKASLDRKNAGVVNATNINSGRASGTGVTTGATDDWGANTSGWTNNPSNDLSSEKDDEPVDDNDN